ncbi:sensor histidine kinase [Actinomadura roseirufa]|uniref:sensor histidine kinase n=1 Tax=Actinomadura roseirufa TaxID=2094049 RepID=UPI0013F147D1|nr:ATP-binding protein [Actinomadura roseirufa]
MILDGVAVLTQLGRSDLSRLLAIALLLTVPLPAGLWVLSRRAMAQVSAIAEREAQRQEATRLLLIALARRLQASAQHIQREAEKLTERLPAGDGTARPIGEDIQRAATQQARHAQSVMVLAGARPTRPGRDDQSLIQVVHSAAARISHHTRVQVIGDDTITVIAPVAEALTHLVAELLDNAVQCSPPTAPVRARVMAVHRGAVLEIDDAGVGLPRTDLARWRRIASGEDTPDLLELGHPPRLGLAVVGHYARRHQLKVSLRESPYGGLTALVFIPLAALVTTVQQSAPPSGTGSAPDTNATPLPQRRRARSEDGPGADTQST